jgi:hypothetical protein
MPAPGNPKCRTDGHIPLDFALSSDVIGCFAVICNCTGASLNEVSHEAIRMFEHLVNIEKQVRAPVHIRNQSWPKTMLSTKCPFMISTCVHFAPLSSMIATLLAKSQLP